MNHSLFLCLNNSQGEVPSRIQLIPPGKVIEGVDGRKWTLKDAHALVKSTNALQTEFPIDENHSTDLAAPKGGRSPALGWFKNLAVDSDGSIRADVEWNSRGEDTVKNREYRYISPVFNSNKDKEIVEILRASLTNRPNLSNPALNSEQPNESAKEQIMDKELCAALGLPETATVNEALAVIATQKAAGEKQTALNAAGGSVDLTAYAPRADLNAMQTRAVDAEKKLVELNTASLKARAETAVTAAIADRKIAPASKDEYLNLCSTEDGLTHFGNIMGKTPELVSGASTVPDKTPDGAGTTTCLNSDEKALASSMGITEDEFLANKEAGK